MKFLANCSFVVVLLAFSVFGQEKPQAFVGARIIPIVGAEIADGVLVVQNGKIIAVGARNSVPIPADAEVINASKMVIMPGLVDSHSHIGEGSGADGTAAMQPDVRVMDAINVLDNSIQRAQSGGITTANIMPGSGHLNSGQTVYLKLRDGRTIDDLLIYDKDNKMMGGMKFANGTNSIRNAPFPGTRAKSASIVRDMLIKAQEYQAKVKRAGGDAAKMPTRDLPMEGLVEVLEGKRMVHFHTHRHDDILTALRLQKEFGFRVVLHHVSEGWKVADEIAKAKVPASIIMIDAPGGKLETIDLKYETGAIMDKAGVLVGYHTDDYITDSRFFLRSAGLGVRAGLSREKALYAVTMANAIMLDMQNRVGSLEKGKDADFIVLSGDPLSIYSHVLQTYVDGKKVFDRSMPKDYEIATGGFGISELYAHVDCFEDLIEGGQR